MKIRLDISLYPLHSDYIPAIDAFIAKLRTYEELKVLTNELSTQVWGEYDLAMKATTMALKENFGPEMAQVAVIKVVWVP